MTALLFISNVLIWGTTFYAITLQLGEVPALQSVFYRFALAAAVLWVFTGTRSAGIRFPRNIHALFALLGLLMFSLNYVVVYYATAYLTSGLVAVIFTLMIPLNTLFYWIFFTEYPTPALVTGGLLGMTGLVALLFDDIYSIGLNNMVYLGVGLTLLSTLLASGGNIIAQFLKLRGINVVSCNTWGMTYGSLFLLLAIIFTGDPWQFSMKAEYVFSLLYLSIAGTAIAFWSYLTLIHRIGAPRAAYITVVVPLVALLLSTLYEDMHWTIYKLLGVAFIIAGNLFIVQRKQSAGTEEPELPKI